MPAQIVVVGSHNMDLVVTTPRLPAVGETILGHKFYTAAGGKGANQAVAAARLGGQVSMIGRVGADAYGEEILANFKREGIDNRYVIVDQDHATGVALISVDDEGRNTIIVASGANWQVTPRDVEAARAALETATCLLLQIEVPLPASERAAQLVRAAGGRVIFNPAPAQELPDSLLALVDVLAPNEAEASQLTGVEVTDRAGAARAAQALLDRGAGAAVVTLGAEGALWCDAEGTSHIPGFPVKAVDTVAAGDCFVGALGVALGRDLSPQEAVRWANAAAALSTTKPGAQPSLPHAAEVEAFLASHS